MLVLPSLLATNQGTHFKSLVLMGNTIEELVAIETQASFVGQSLNHRQARISGLLDFLYVCVCATRDGFSK